MNLVRANIRRCFRALCAGEVSFDEEFRLYVEANAIDTSRFFHSSTLTPWPTMYGTPDHIRCIQKELFGWYVVRASVRATLMAANWLVAAQTLLEKTLLGPASAAAYTCAYHALHGFLALNGRVICDPYYWVGPELVPLAPALAGVLTDRNIWRFEVRQRSHKARWLEVRQLYSSPRAVVSPRFTELFNFLFAGRIRKGVSLQEFMRNPADNRPQLVDHWEEFLTGIAHIRHDALYSSFGEDPRVVEALVNRDTFSTAGLTGQTQALTDFGAALLQEVAAETGTILAEIDCPDRLRGWFFISVHMPWMDNVRLEQISDPALRELVYFVRDATIPPEAFRGGAGA